MKDNGLATGGTGVDTEVGTHDIQISVLAQANTPPNSIPYTRTINEDTPYVFHLGARRPIRALPTSPSATRRTTT